MKRRGIRNSKVALLAVAAWWVMQPCSPREAEAAAPATEECVRAFHETQKLRRDGKLRSARENAASCGKSDCPAALVTECVHWLREIDESMPSVVLSARDSSGADVLVARVLFDGEPLTDKLDGRAIAVDPGEHVLRFEARDGQVLDKQVVIRQGERDRRIVVDFVGPSTTPTLIAPLAASSAPTAASARAAPTPWTPPPHQAPIHSRNVPVSALVFGAVGVLGTAGFVYFGLTARSQLDDLRTGCAPNCNPGDVDSARHKAWLADASLGLGIVSFGLAGWLALRRPTRQDSVSIGVAPGWVGLAGRF